MEYSGKKFNLRYKFIYQYNKNNFTNVITIRYPFTVDFLVQRGIGDNTATFTIYGLNDDSIELMRKSRANFSSWRRVIFECGYNDESHIRFRGNVLEAFTIKTEADIKTTIHCVVEGYDLNNNSYNSVFSEGTNHLTIFNDLANKTDFEKGDIDIQLLAEERLKRSTTFTGRTLQLLKDFLGNNVSTDLQRLTVKSNIASKETSKGMVVYKNKVFTIDDSHGLITTPVGFENLLDIDLILEPRINLYDVVYLFSKYATNFNGYYKVLQIVEQGTITKTGSTQGCKTSLKLQKFDGTLL
jgi:hypothetical protein